MFRRLAISTFAALLFVSAGLTYSARAQGLGISVGANFNSLSDVDTGDRQATFENATGWHLHLWFDLPVGPVAIRPGLRYTDVGEVFDDARIGVDPFRVEQVVTMLEIPVDLRIRLGVPIVTPYVMAGPVLRFPAGTDDEDRLKSFSLAGGAGIGVELGLVGIKLFPELKYTFGITRFTQDSYEIGGVTISPDGSQRLNAVMLSLGVGL